LLALLRPVVTTTERRSFSRKSIELAREVGDTASLGVSTANLGELAFQRGEYSNAEGLFRTAHGLFTDLQHAGGLAYVFHHLALVKLAQSEYEEALEYLGDALRSGHARGDVEIMAYCLGAAASVALGQQDAERAALLLGAAESMRRRIGIALSPKDQRENEAARAASRDTLGSRAFEEAWANGAEMTSDEAVACVLGEVRST
jgi:non-specific serine/threonine protein kinase